MALASTFGRSRVEPATTALRCNSIERVTIPKKLTGWTLHVDDGIDDTKPKTFGACKVDKISVEPMQGGTATLRMRIGTSDLDDERSGMLGMHVGQSIWIQLIAPQPGQESAGDDEQASDPDATDLFVEGADA